LTNANMLKDQAQASAKAANARATEDKSLADSAVHEADGRAVASLARALAADQQLVAMRDELQRGVGGPVAEAVASGAALANRVRKKRDENFMLYKCVHKTENDGLLTITRLKGDVVATRRALNKELERSSKHDREALSRYDLLDAEKDGLSRENKRLTMAKERREPETEEVANIIRATLKQLFFVCYLFISNIIGSDGGGSSSSHGWAGCGDILLI
jgi:hypothetical protein